MFVFTHHARQRMTERNIAEKEIKKTIDNPDRIAYNFDKIIVNKKIGKKIIEVVFIRKNSKIVIITCYLL